MGEWRQPVSVKMSDAERAELQRIHDALAPMHETLSQTIRWALRMMGMLMFTLGMLQRFDAMLQGIQWSESVGRCAAAAQEARRLRKPPVKRERPVSIAGRGSLLLLPPLVWAGA